MSAGIRQDTGRFTAAKGGDLAAWTELMRKHAPRLAAYLGARLRRPAVVDSLVSEAVFTGSRRLGEVADPAQFAGWFRKLGAGIAMRWAREHPDEPLEEPFPAGRLPAAQAGEAARLAAVEAAIGRLGEQQRMALELRWRGGMDAIELAEALRCTPSEAERLANEAETALLDVSDDG